MILYSIYIMYNYSFFVLQKDTDNVDTGTIKAWDTKNELQHILRE